MPAMAASMTSTSGLTDSYIMLTPTSGNGEGLSQSAPASDLLARKWAKAAKRKLSRGASREVIKVAEHDSEPEDSSPTETDRSSELGNNETPSSDGSKSERGSDVVRSSEDKQDDDEEDEDEETIFPTYVCELHDPKAILVAEQVPYNRVDVVPCEPVESGKRTASNNAAYYGSAASATSSAPLAFRYEVSVGTAQAVFICTPSKVLEVFKALSRDKSIGDQLRFIERNCLADGFRGSLRRIYASAELISQEIVDVLEAISDVDAVLLHPAYLGLIGAQPGSALHGEIEGLLEQHRKTPRSDSTSTCMCEVYYQSVLRFGEFYSEQAQAVGSDSGRQSTVASESLMWSRGVLSFYTDTIYTLDKRDFRPTHGLKKCSVYGFGRRKLFEVVRTSRKRWSVRHVTFGELYTLSLEKYAHGVNSHHMVAITRAVPDTQHGGMRWENVCFVKKSKRLGYRCLLMSEVISQGKVSTSISMQKPKSPPGDPNSHYVTMSDISGTARSSVCSSTLSVPAEEYKHIQRLNVSGGSDVLAFIAIATSYDIIVGALSYWMERKY